MIDTAADALTSGELLFGLVIGTTMSVALLLTRGAIAPRQERRPWVGAKGPLTPAAGLFMAGGGALAIAETSSLTTGAVLGIVLLAAAGWFAGRSMLRGLLLAVPGAALIAAAGPGAPTWIPFAVVVATVLGGPATANFDRRYATLGLGPALYGLSVCAVYVTVPDTEQALALMGAVVPLAIIGWPLRVARLGSAGAFASVGLLAWVVATGGQARSSAVIGGLACLGILVIEPTARVVAAFRSSAGDNTADSTADVTSERRPGPLSIAVLHIVVLLLASRVVGRLSSVPAALTITAAVALGTFLLLLLLARSSRRR